MFRPILTLLRGVAGQAAEATIDANALMILDQQIRDCGLAIAKARKALALALAQARQERTRLERLRTRIEDLEHRAKEALQAGQEALAAEAAEAIAALETERDAVALAQSGFDAECERLGTIIRTAESRFRELERGRRLARTKNATLELRDAGLLSGESYRNTLCDAEATLARLQTRQDELDHAGASLEALGLEAGLESMADKMAAAGFGPPTRRRSTDVLERLRADLDGGSAPRADTDEDADVASVPG